MKKSFVLYNAIEVEGELMDCIYFLNGECRAQPSTDNAGKCYVPTKEEQLDYCKDEYFPRCPRFIAYQTHLKAIGFQK